MRGSLIIPTALIAFVGLLLIYILWTGQFRDAWILGSFFMVAWGTHLIIAYVRGTTMWTGPLPAHNTDDVRYIRLGIMLLGIVFCLYFSIQIISLSL